MAKQANNCHGDECDTINPQSPAQSMCSETIQRGAERTTEQSKCKRGSITTGRPRRKGGLPERRRRDFSSGGRKACSQADRHSSREQATTAPANAGDPPRPRSSPGNMPSAPPDSRRPPARRSDTKTGQRLSWPEAVPQQQSAHAPGAPLAAGTGERETGEPGQGRKAEAEGGETTGKT